MLLDELGQCSWSCAFKDVVFGQEVTGTCRISLTAAVMSRKCCSPLQHSAVLTDGKPSLRRRVPHKIELGDSHRRLTNLLKCTKRRDHSVKMYTSNVEMLASLVRDMHQKLQYQQPIGASIADTGSIDTSSNTKNPP